MRYPGMKTWTTKRIIFWRCVLFYSPIPEIFFFRCHYRIHFLTILSFWNQINPHNLSVTSPLSGRPRRPDVFSVFIISSFCFFFNSLPFQLHFLKHILKQWITQWVNCLWGHFWCCLAQSCTFCTRTFDDTVLQVQTSTDNLVKCFELPPGF